MKHGGLLTLSAGIALVALTLTGCTATPNSEASQSPSAQASSPASTAPTPTPTPATAAKPGVRVPIGCAELLDTAAVAAITGSHITIDQDENSKATDLASAAQLQFGALTCGWDGLGHGSVSYKGSNLTVSVAPDSKAAFDSRFEAIMAAKNPSGHPAPTLDVAGDRSGFWCANTLDALGADANLVICDGEMTVAGYWVGLQVDTVYGPTRVQLTSGITAALKQIAQKLTAAQPAVGQWVAPATTPSRSLHLAHEYREGEVDRG